MGDSRLREVERGQRVTVVFDGRELTAYEGESLALALWADGVRGLRGASRTGEPRGVFCCMGVCYECLVDVAGRAVRACMEPVRGPRMVVTSRRPER